MVFAYNLGVFLSSRRAQILSPLRPPKSRATYAFRAPAGARCNRGRDLSDLPLRPRRALLVAPLRGRVPRVHRVGVGRLRAGVVARDGAGGARAGGRGLRLAAAAVVAGRLARAPGLRLAGG